MQRVYKYSIPFEDMFKLDLPKGAKILSFQCQYEQPAIWAMVDPDAPKESRQFILRGTGQDINLDAINFIGTAQMAGGRLVWHLFEVLF